MLPVPYFCVVMILFWKKYYVIWETIFWKSDSIELKSMNNCTTHLPSLFEFLPRELWESEVEWLILGDNLIGSQGVQIFDKTLFLRVSVRIFSDEMHIWIHRLSRAVYPPQCEWTQSNSQRAWKGTKRPRKNLALPVWLPE